MIFPSFYQQSGLMISIIQNYYRYSELGRRKSTKMKSTRNIRLITDVIAKRTTTTTPATAKAAPAAADQLNYYETQCPRAVGQNGNILPNSSSDATTPFTYETVRPYSEVPGPKPLPILGNTWR